MPARTTPGSFPFGPGYPGAELLSNSSRDPGQVRFAGADGSNRADLLSDELRVDQIGSGFFVRGRVIDVSGKPVSGASVIPFDRDLRSEQALLDKPATTNAEGAFEATYTSARFRLAEKGTADLFFRVSDSSGISRRVTDLRTDAQVVSDPLYLPNAPSNLQVDIVIEAGPKLSEYESALWELTPVLDGVEPVDLTNEDVVFLVRETDAEPGSFAGRSRATIEFLRASAQRSSQTGIPAEAFYAFARQDPSLPRYWVKLLETPPRKPDQRLLVVDAILDGLTKTAREDLRKALVNAIDQNIAPASLKDRIEDVLRALRHVGSQLQTPAKLSDQDSREALANYSVRVFDLDSGDPPDDLGLQLIDGFGAFRLAYPADPRISGDAKRRLRVRVSGPDAKEIAQQDLEFKQGQTETVDIKIPVPKAPEPPLHTLDKLAETVKLDIPAPLKSFLEARQIRSLADIRSTGGLGRLKDLPIAPDHAAVKTLEAHADLSRISPDVEFNSSLIQKG
jgi:hypothetical protein